MSSAGRTRFYGQRVNRCLWFVQYPAGANAHSDSACPERIEDMKCTAVLHTRGSHRRTPQIAFRRNGTRLEECGLLCRTTFWRRCPQYCPCIWIRTVADTCRCSADTHVSACVLKVVWYTVRCGAERTCVADMHGAVRYSNDD